MLLLVSVMLVEINDYGAMRGLNNTGFVNEKVNLRFCCFFPTVKFSLSKMAVKCSHILSCCSRNKILSKWRTENGAVQDIYI